MRKGTTLLAILQLILASTIIAVFGALMYYYRRDIAVYQFYIIIFVFGMVIFVPTCITLLVHGLRSLLPARVGRGGGIHQDTAGIGKGSIRKRLVLFAAYLACAVIGLVVAMSAVLPNIAMMREDLGVGVYNTIVAFYVSGSSILVVMGLSLLPPVRVWFARLRAGSRGKSRVVGASAGSPKAKKRLSGGTGGFQALLLILTIIVAGFTYVVTEALEPPTCNHAPLGFSEPAYDFTLVNGTSHYNASLDTLSAEDASILAALEKGLWAMTKLQQMGGFPMRALPDGSEMYSDRGESCPLFPGEFSLQGGTPLVAMQYLDMYRLEPNPVYLGVATSAAEALIAVQEVDGGFFYDGRRYPNGDGYIPHPRNGRRSAVLDDNVMQSCLDYLLEIYNETGNQTYLDAALKGFDLLFEIEIPGGGWPQRTGYDMPTDYQNYVTLNDGCMEDVVMVMLKAYDMLGDARYLAAAERAGQFLIRVQGNGGSPMQAGWAQQYDRTDMPAWARAFEPPAICSSQTAGAIRILQELYLYTANESYLAPIPAAISWLLDDNTTISWNETEDNVTVTKYGWARLYELQTNRMIVGNRNNKENGPLYYYDYVPERDYGYSWVGTYGINATIENYYRLVNSTADGGFDKNITAYLEWRNRPKTTSIDTAKRIRDEQNDDGFWLSDGLIRDSTFAGKVAALIRYFKYS